MHMTAMEARREGIQLQRACRLDIWQRSWRMELAKARFDVEGAQLQLQ